MGITEKNIETVFLVFRGLEKIESQIDKKLENEMDNGLHRAI